MPSTSPDDAALARSFSRAAAGYDEHAQTQKAIAAKLAAMIVDAEPGGRAQGPLLDLGCGTGLLLGELLKGNSALEALGIDAAPGMIDFCRKKWADKPSLHFETADMQQWRKASPFAHDFRWAASNCAFQWIAELDAALARAREALQPDGRFAAAVFVEGSLPELAASHRAVRGTEPAALAWRSADFYAEAFERAGFVCVEQRLERSAVAYADPFALLAALRGIGAVPRGPGAAPPFSPPAMRAFARHYAQNFAAPGGVTATYAVLYWLGKRIA